MFKKKSEQLQYISYVCHSPKECEEETQKNKPHWKNPKVSDWT